MLFKLGNRCASSISQPGIGLIFAKSNGYLFCSFLWRFQGGKGPGLFGAAGDGTFT